MSTYSLIPHPGQACSPPAAVRVYATRTDAQALRLSYLVDMSLRDLRLPPARPAARRDGLWRATCFELFLALDTGYAEINLSPSTSWAAYRFDGYRDGMRPLDVPAPRIDQNGGSGWYELVADIALPAGVTGAIGLSAVIETADGAKSHWALAHAAGVPDFHDPACFVATLPAPGLP